MPDRRRCIQYRTTLKTLLVLLVGTMLQSGALPACAAGGPYENGRFKGRIGYSADGNFNDPDDWIASPLALAIFAECGLKDRLVHFDYNCILPKSNPDWEKTHAESVLGAAERYGYRGELFHDCRRDLEEAVASIARAIDASSAPFSFIVAGPMEVPCLDAGCWMLDAGCWMLDAGCWMLDIDGDGLGVSSIQYPVSSMYEVFEHTADLGLRVRAADLETLFAEAGKGLVSQIADLASVQPKQETSFRIPGQDLDYLLFDWLNELLFAFEKDRMLYCEFAVTRDAEGLTAKARGEPLDPSRHELDHEVKAITYHGLKVEQQADGWLAEVIVDI